MMMPSNLDGGNGSAKHQQQLMQSASMLPSPYNFLPSVFANAQLDMPLFRPPESVCFGISTCSIYLKLKKCYKKYSKFSESVYLRIWERCI